tara:strand:+ start:227 stop:784 length:558 start_codon:yes stop_codon:yes gene_type:complete
MFNFFKKSEYEEISQKIKYKNHKITEALNKTEFNKFLKLSSKKRKEYLREFIEGISGTDYFAEVFGYTFSFKDLPQFNYLLSVSEDNYNLGISGKKEYFGFRCDYLLSENVYLLSLRTKEENDKDHDDLKNILGKASTQVLEAYKDKPAKYETTKKAKKLHDEMIGTMYLNEFSYNERKKNPIRV